MAIIDGRDIGVQLCELLELRPEYVRRITINVEPAEIVTIGVILAMDTGQAGEIVEAIKRYRLEEIKDETTRPNG